MALTLLKRVQPPKGPGIPSKPQVRVGENGAITFSAAASEALTGKELAVLQWDGDKRLLEIRGFPKPTKFPAKVNGESFAEEDFLKVNKPKSGKAFSISMAGNLRMLGYDYAASGGQVFDAEVDVKKASIQFTLPSGKLAPKPKIERKKKTAAAAADAGKPAEAQPQTNGSAASGSDEMTLQ